MAKDPICNMEVDEETAEFKSQFMEAKYIAFVQKNVKNNLTLGPNSMRVSRKNAM
jgi:YHS domain-containing protein